MWRLPLLAGIVGLVFGLTGCKKPPLELYEPGSINAWRTVAEVSAAGDVLTEPASALRPQVLLETSLGDITVELFEEQAPITVANFLGYVESGQYEGTIFHRVIPAFMIQGGGFTVDMVEKETGAPIRNEAGNGVRNQRGTLAMARTSVIDSATAQFFVNVVDNAFLNGDGINDGYAVFGRVIAGMDVVDQLAIVETGVVNGMQDVPLAPLEILRATRIDANP